MAKTANPTIAPQLLAAFLRGPWSAAEAAKIAGLPTGTFRNYVDRKPPRINARKFLRLDGEGDPRPRFSTAEVLQAAALAEVGQYGIAPGREPTPYLVDSITRDLFERAFGRGGRGEREPGKWFAPGFCVAEVRRGSMGVTLREAEGLAPFPQHLLDQASEELEEERRERGESRPLSIQSVGPGEQHEDLASYFGVRDREASATWIVIDTAALFRRIVARMAEARSES